MTYTLIKSLDVDKLIKYGHLLNQEPKMLPVGFYGLSLIKNGVLHQYFLQKINIYIRLNK